MTALAAALALATTLHLGYGDGPRISADWKTVSYRGRTNYTVERDSTRTWLRAEARGQNSALFHPVGVDVGDAVLDWSWRVLRHPTGADTRTRAGDDRAAAVFVLVQRSILPWRTRGLVYQWADAGVCGEWESSPYASGIKVITLQNAPAGGPWRAESRDLGADLRAAFGPGQRTVQAIGVLCDSDDTGSVAASEIGELRLTWADAEPVAPPPKR